MASVCSRTKEKAGGEKKREKKREKEGGAMSRCEAKSSRLGRLFAQKWRRDVGRYETSRYPRASIGQLSNMHTMLRIPYVHPRVQSFNVALSRGKTLRSCATLIYHFEVGERKRNVAVSNTRLSFSPRLICPYRSGPRGVNRASPQIYSRVTCLVSRSGEKIGRGRGGRERK